MDFSIFVFIYRNISLELNHLTKAGADKYIFEALELGQVAQQNLFALPSNVLALLQRLFIVVKRIKI